MKSAQPERRIALVTGRDMAKPDPESHLLVAALAERGIVADMQPWQAEIDWATYPLVVVRTPWDYFRERAAFLTWSARVAGQTRLVNPPEVLAWNSHKGYLRNLAEQGVPTVPTLWLARGSAGAAQALAETGWTQVVVKPAVSIGAIGALRGQAADPAVATHLEQLLDGDDVLVQPFVESIAETGELALIYFGGRYSHAVCKRPQAGDYRVQDMYGGRNAAIQPDPEALALASAALAQTPAPTSYARVDMVRHAGRWVLMELELIEPELFLPYDPQAAANFAGVIEECLMAG